MGFAPASTHVWPVCSAAVLDILTIFFFFPRLLKAPPVRRWPQAHWRSPPGNGNTSIHESTIQALVLYRGLSLCHDTCPGINPGTHHRRAPPRPHYVPRPFARPALQWRGGAPCPTIHPRSPYIAHYPGPNDYHPPHRLSHAPALLLTFCGLLESAE